MDNPATHRLKRDFTTVRDFRSPGSRPRTIPAGTVVALLSDGRYAATGDRAEASPATIPSWDAIWENEKSN